MSEGFDEAVASRDSDEGREPTGNATVDAVLTSLGQLEDAPVADHVAVFEDAHEKLRGALADLSNVEQTS